MSGSRERILGVAVLIGAALVSALPARAQNGSSLPPLAADHAPGVDVWLDTDFYESLVEAQAFFNAVPGSYVTIIRVSNKNTLEVLFPSSPADQHPFVRSNAARTPLSFRTDAGTGLGVIYAISSDKPFDYSKVSDGRRWNSKRLAHPKGESVPEVAGYFLNEISEGVERRFAMSQAAYINGAAIYKVGDPGFPTVASVIDAAGLACHWAGRDTEGRVCADTTSTRRPIKDLGKAKGVITGTMANPPPPDL